MMQVIHRSLSHLDSGKGGYVRLLFIDFSSAFNTMVPRRLADKVIELGLNTPLCTWIQDFLTSRPQVIRVGRHPSRPLNPEHMIPPRGCILSPLLSSLYTDDCVARSSSNTIVKFADDILEHRNSI